MSSKNTTIRIQDTKGQSAQNQTSSEKEVVLSKDTPSEQTQDGAAQTQLEGEVLFEQEERVGAQEPSGQYAKYDIARFSDKTRALIEQYMQTVGAGQIALESLLRYGHEMKPGVPQSPTSGAQQQVRFFTEIIGTINSGMPNFDQFLGLYLHVVHQLSKDGEAFSGSYPHRFMPQVMHDREWRYNFEAFMTGIKHLANPNNRNAAAMRHVDFKQITAAMSPEGAARFREFFSV